MAVGVDQAGKQDRFAQVHHRFARGNRMVRPPADKANPVSRNLHRAIIDGRLRDRQNDASAEDHGQGLFRFFRMNWDHEPGLQVAQASCL